mmetsp:Transcript_121236/g.387363  ORF Transcript_121236/g.387363 Transcript_121236/m.387363 type:complete len:222 (+) Transcript_121236:929-1594(+)
MRQQSHQHPGAGQASPSERMQRDNQTQGGAADQAPFHGHQEGSGLGNGGPGSFQPLLLLRRLHPSPPLRNALGRGAARGPQGQELDRALEPRASLCGGRQAQGEEQRGDRDAEEALAPGQEVGPLCFLQRRVLHGPHGGEHRAQDTDEQEPRGDQEQTPGALPAGAHDGSAGDHRARETRVGHGSFFCDEAAEAPRPAAHAPIQSQVRVIVGFLGREACHL